MKKFSLHNTDCLEALGAGRIAGLDLIYIDPPFNSGRDYCYIGKVELAGEKAFTDVFNKTDVAAEMEILEAEAPRAYEYLRFIKPDVSAALFNYLAYMAPRLALMRKALKETGSVYVHCDDAAVFYLKCLMDYIYGAKNFKNCITWERAAGMNGVARRFIRIADYILFYTKGKTYTFNPQYTPLKESTVKGYNKRDEYGRLYKTEDVYGPTTGRVTVQEWVIDGVVYKAPKGYSYRWTQATLESRRAEHRAKYGTELIEINRNGNPVKKTYLEDSKGSLVKTVWTDVSISSSSKERLGYPTQKPEALLERIIKASSNPGDLVADFFIGSGTTGAAALKLGRRFVGCDVNPEAIRMATERLEAINVEAGV